MDLTEAMSRLILDEVAHTKTFDDVTRGTVVRRVPGGGLYQVMDVFTESGVPLVRQMAGRRDVVFLVFDYVVERN